MWRPWDSNLEIPLPENLELVSASDPLPRTSGSALASDPYPSTSGSVPASDLCPSGSVPARDLHPSTSDSVPASDLHPSTSGSVADSDPHPSTSNSVPASYSQQSTSGLSPASGFEKKRNITKTLNKQRQNLGCNVYEYVSINNLGKGHILETAKALKLNTKTVGKFVRRCPVTPKKPGNNKTKFNKLDNFCYDLVKREM